MPAASDAWVARQFSALSAAERRRFLAALWEARGYETGVDGGSVVVHGDETRRLAVVGRWPWRPCDADIVVGVRDTNRARAYADARDAEFVPPAALRRLLLYGIERDDAEDLTREYFGTSVTEAPASRLPSRLPPPALLSVLTIAMVVVIASSLGPVPAASSPPHVSGATAETRLRSLNQSPPSATPSLPLERSCVSPYSDAERGSASTYGHASPIETVSVRRLVRMHQDQIANRPLQVTFSYTGPPNTTFKSSVVSERISLRTNGSHGRYVRRQRIRDRSEATTEWTDDVYLDDQGIWIHRNNNTRPLRSHVWRDLQRSLLWPYRTVPDEMRVTRVRLLGDEIYRLTAKTDSAERAHYRAVAYVTPCDRLVYLSISYVHPETGDAVSIEVEYDTLDPETEISPPPWYQEGVLENGSGTG